MPSNGKPQNKGSMVTRVRIKLGQLAHGMPGQNTDTNTIVFIHCTGYGQGHHLRPNYMLGLTRKINEQNKTRLVARCNRVHYLGNAGTPTTNLLTIKLLIYNTITTAGAKFMTMDLKDFYLNTPMA